MCIVRYTYVSGNYCLEVTTFWCYMVGMRISLTTPSPAPRAIRGWGGAGGGVKRKGGSGDSSAPDRNACAGVDLEKEVLIIITINNTIELASND